MLIQLFWLQNPFSQSVNLDLTLFANYGTLSWAIQIQLPFAKLRQASRGFKMENIDGTRSTIDNTAGFLTARIRVGLFFRLRCLTASSVCRADMCGSG